MVCRVEKIKSLSYLQHLKEAENLKIKATYVQIQYFQNVQRILSQLKQNAVLV